MPSGQVNKNGKIIRIRGTEDQFCSSIYTSGSDHEGSSDSSTDHYRFVVRHFCLTLLFF